MEPAVQLPSQYIFFDVSGAGGLRCFGPAPAAGHGAAVPFGTQVLALEALRRTRLSGAHRVPPFRVGTAVSGDLARTSDPDTVSDAGTSGVRAAEVDGGGESEDEVDSLDELLFEERLLRKIDALAELVGMEGAGEPAAVLGEVVRVLQELEQRRGSVLP
ncbi:hypothetical protein ACP4OV_024786 [Aristida adscensionis]